LIIAAEKKTTTPRNGCRRRLASSPARPHRDSALQDRALDGRRVGDAARPLVWAKREPLLGWSEVQ